MGYPIQGVLMVHLVEDDDNAWFPFELTPGEGMFMAQFDKVADATYGTTVNIDESLLLFPASYAREGQP